MNQNTSRGLFSHVERTIEWIIASQSDSKELRLQKKLLVVTSATLSTSGIGWGFLILFNNEALVSSIPFAYAAISILNIAIFRLTHRYQIFRFVHLLISLMLPFLLLVALGGYQNSGAVMLWALVAPLGATLLTGRRQAIIWFVAFLALVAIGGLIEPFGRQSNNLSPILVTVFFVLNVGAPSTLAIVLILYFLNQKDTAQKLLEQEQKALRESEIMLRQREKMAQLGTLAAGVAHELNNPAAAVSRGAQQLQTVVTQFGQAHSRLSELHLTDSQQEILNSHAALIKERATKPLELNALDRSDLEYVLEAWLKRHNIDNAREFAPALVSVGCNLDRLDGLARDFSGDQLSVMMRWLAETYTAHNLLTEIGIGAGRISQIVNALKSYSYLDQAPVQGVDVHEGLNNTLLILSNKLKTGINVKREYASDLPKIQAYGSELNQVWTNILDNAADALEGRGDITIRTRRDNECVVVEIEDNGPGIPEEIQHKIFDSFFTTKPPGKGTGLGLNISYNIVVQHHRGDIKVFSHPGKTCFQVWLPNNFEANQDDGSVG